MELDALEAEVQRELIRVRQHLRGETRFAWRGLACQVIPSAYDLERAERLRCDRYRKNCEVVEWARSTGVSPGALSAMERQALHQLEG